MIKKNNQNLAPFNLVFRGSICFFLTFCSLQLNIVSKDFYHRTRIPKITSTKVSNLVAEVISGTTSKLTEEISVYVEPPYKDCAVTIRVTDSLVMIPKSVATQAVQVLKYIGATDGVMRLHYEGNKLKFLGILENKKYKKVAVKYGRGWFSKEGVQLDKKYSIPPFLSIVKSNDDSKKSRISDGYGYRIHPIYRKKIFHPGVDIAAPAGSSVFAALPGRVKKVAYSRSYGTYLLLEHQGGLETKYAHLRSIDRKIILGKEISQGSVIGFVGQTGSATGPHLHFEVRLDAKHVNPASVKPFALQLKGDDLKQIQKLYTDYNKQLRTRYPIQLNIEDIISQVKPNEPADNTGAFELKEAIQSKANISRIRSNGRSKTTKSVTKLLTGITKLSAA